MAQAALILSDAALDDAPAAQTERAYRALRERVEAMRTPAFWPAKPGRRPPSVVERAGLVRLACAIPGPGGEAEAHAVIEALRYAPEGDIVEIGAGWGRSAALLVLLAHHWDIGPVLCVERWCGADETIFEINLAPLARGRLNTICGDAQGAAARYAPGLRVVTPTFGATDYAGRIAVLHIAGDQPASEAAREVALWSPQLVPGGWVILDEGAPGRRRRPLAEAFLVREAEHIGASFAAGAALFVQLKACARG